MKLNFICFKATLVVLTLLTNLNVNAQVTIGSGFPAKSGSILDLKENDNPGVNSTKGLLCSRVRLEGLTTLEPCIPSSEFVAGDETTHIGLVVYNMRDDLSIGLCPGLHVWDGATWVRLPEPCQPAPIDPDLINTPNCYIVAPGAASEEIPVGKPYLVWEQRSDLEKLSRADKVSLDLIWQDVSGLISGVELVDGDQGPFSKIKVTANNLTGNALVAVRIGPNGNNTDPIRWSWHIWVTSYDPNNGGTTYTTNNGEKTYVFMDRNIGATTVNTTDANSMGMTYQWGRKDPFPANKYFGTGPDFRDLYNSSNTIITEVDELNTETVGTGIQHMQVADLKNLGKSILNPVIYYYAQKDDTDTSNDRSDWFTTDETGASSDSDLWGGISGTKSPFDPCPAGWKVPQMSSETKSPWDKYENGGGWDPEYTMGSTGVTMGGTMMGTQPSLGFYPYGFPRFPRPIVSCVTVGCAGQNYVGGAFVGSYVVNSERGAYWTATSSANNLAAKTSGIVGAGSPMPSFTNMDFAKSGGAYVRCVKE
ncbi:hypothetical protein [Dysgonomonas sp. BGC7]|uniref:hypothetical protein n=1 Tax=Dysgonomonas sp. BGC7 TaxID=1658008 RepID=UPI00067FE139|nr:hypothetical protein [Dysgonomonas sp. BGC7]MBD8387607.1 hypothetical protein [Dysgonomonas sp. BGC7]